MAGNVRHPASLNINSKNYKVQTILTERDQHHNLYLMRKETRPNPKLNVQVDLKKAEKYHVVLNLANVFFPYQPYSQQVDIVAAIQKSINNQENALIESPTGTGKTLCLLVGALSSLVDAPFRKKVYYLTRTHSQISQVVTEFKKTVYNCHLNIVASRQHFCINHNLSKLKGKMLEKACEDLCGQKLCTYKEMGNARRPREALQLQQFKEYCKKEMTCPYYFSKQLTEKSELTILPFNYLLDWSLFQRSSLDLKDSIIIFDEAHNIDSLCEQGSDIKLPLDLLTQTISQLKSLVRAQNSKTLHPQFKDKYEDRQDAVQFKIQIELLLSKIKSINESEVISRHDLLGKLQEFTTTPKQQGVDLGNYRDFVARGKKITKMFYKKELQCQSLHLFLIIFDKIYEIMGCNQEFLKFTISMSNTQLLFRCLDPSLCFSRITSSKPRSIILSSGTLGDLDLWQKNLKIKFHHKIATDSFVTERHLYAQIRPKGENGVAYNFSFQGKQNQEQFQSISKELRKLQDIVQGGIIVAFSTYQLLERTMRYCTDLKNKVYFETKGGNIEEVYLQFQEEVKKGTGFLFIVMKGRFSEGINFTGVLCRCLIVVGIPFLPLKDPGVMQKMKYLENNCSRAQSEQWYTLQSFKSLNQTLGRAIRNKEDYSVILLMDQRYSKEEYQGYLSKWFTKCLRKAKNGLEDIKQFLLKAEQNIFQESKAKTSSKNKREITLCHRLAEFSTPNKSKKNKKLKLVLDSDEKSQDEKGFSLKKIKIVEDEPYYDSMNKDLQDYFIDFTELQGDDTIKKDEGQVHDLQQVEQTVVKAKTQKTMIPIMRSYGKYRDGLDF